MAEAFVKTFKRDYAYVHELPSAAAVLAAVPQWVTDYNESHPHRGLGMKSPREYRAATRAERENFTPNPSAVTY